MPLDLTPKVSVTVTVLDRQCMTKCCEMQRDLKVTDVDLEEKVLHFRFTHTVYADIPAGLA